MTPWTTAHQAPPFMGFSRQEYWSGVPLPSPKIKVWLSVKESACNAGDMDSVSGLGRSWGEGNGNLLQYPYLEIPQTEEPDRPQFMGLQRVDTTELLNKNKGTNIIKSVFKKE